MDGGGNKLCISQLVESNDPYGALWKFGIDRPGELGGSDESG